MVVAESAGGGNGKFVKQSQEIIFAICVFEKTG